MARFALQKMKTERMLGQSMLGLATLKAIARKAIRSEDNEAKDVADKAILNCQKFVNDQLLDVSEPQGAECHETDVEVVYHYDGPSDDGYLLHIVVPDIGSKEVHLASAVEQGWLPNVKLPEQNAHLANDPTYDFTDFAAESLGHIVIFGCGR